MQRYYFNVFDGKNEYDNVGTLLPDKKAVRQLMLVRGADILKSEPTPVHGWRMEVLDANGTIICGMHFGIEDDDIEPRLASCSNSAESGSGQQSLNIRRLVANASARRISASGYARLLVLSK